MSVVPIRDPGNSEEAKLPPALADVEAERAALGAVLVSPPALEDVRSAVAGPADFYLPAHEVIYGAMLAMDDAGDPVEPIALARFLGKEVARCGGPLYLHSLMEACHAPATASYYAALVAERAAARRGWTLAKAAVQAFEEGRDPGDVADTLATRVLETVTVGAAEAMIPIGEIHDLYADTLDAPFDEDGGPMCAWSYLDVARTLGDLRAGELIVVAGRPAMGKSTCAADQARDVAIRQGGTVAVFTLEMTKREWWERCVAAEARVPYERIRDGECTKTDLAHIGRHADAIKAAKMFIDDSEQMTVGYIRQRCRQVQRKHGLNLVIIDYLQLLHFAGRAESREREVSSMSRSLKIMAKALGVPVILVAQLNRGPEQRQDKKPMMSDLRESGSVEQDANKIVLVFREDAYDKESPRAGEADLIIGKNRSGPTGTITVAAQLHYARFVSMAEETTGAANDFSADSIQARQGAA